MKHESIFQKSIRAVNEERKFYILNTSDITRLPILIRIFIIGIGLRIKFLLLKIQSTLRRARNAFASSR